MSADLPRLVVRTDSFDPVVLSRSPDLPDDVVARLTALDYAVPSGAMDRLVPVAAGWAVGRRRDDDTIWRLVGATADEDPRAAASLWTADGAFGDGLFALPPLLSLRDVVAHVPAAHRELARAAALLARGEAVALTLPDTPLEGHRWAALALLAMLPPARRARLAVAIGEPSPTSDRYDLVLHAGSPAGYVAVSREPHEEDVVAYYLCNRLDADDPEAIEAAARWPDARWFDHLSAMVRSGLPGVSDLDAAGVRAHPDRAAQVLAVRIFAGSTLDPTMLHLLVELTHRTWDVRPWRALAAVAPARMEAALRAVLHRPSERAPSADWLGAVGAHVGPLRDLWIEHLLQWLDLAEEPPPLVRELERVLLDVPRTPEHVATAADAIETLIHAGHMEEASDLWCGPLMKVILAEGHGSALFQARRGRSPDGVDGIGRVPTLLSALTWPSEQRPERERARVIVALAHALGEEPLLARAALVAWRQRPGADPSDDPVLAQLRGTGLERWWGPSVPPADRPDANSETFDLFGSEEGGEVVPFPFPPAPAAAPAPGGGGELRGLLETMAATPGGSPEHSLSLAEAAVGRSDFPDLALAATAEKVARRKTAPPIWSFLAVTAAPQDAWDDRTIDATVVAYCRARTDETSAAIARECMHRLGRASGWEPLDHARWIVRVALAPRAASHWDLVVALVEGILQRVDAVPFMAGVLRAMFDLPPDHEGSRALVAALPAAGWSGERLNAVLQSIGLIHIPLSFRRTLVTIAEAQA